MARGLTRMRNEPRSMFTGELPAPRRSTSMASRSAWARWHAAAEESSDDVVEQLQPDAVVVELGLELVDQGVELHHDVARVLAEHGAADEDLGGRHHEDARPV